MEKKHRKIGRLEIITIVTLVAIWATTALFASNNRFNSSSIATGIWPGWWSESATRSLQQRTGLVKIGNHEYLYNPKWGSCCHYEDCSYCKTHNKH